MTQTVVSIYLVTELRQLLNIQTQIKEQRTRIEKVNKIQRPVD